VKHCGRETCAGHTCANFNGCRGETVPPWNYDTRHPSTAAVSIREQDVLAAADALAAAVDSFNACEHIECLTIPCENCGWANICAASEQYKKARKGKTK